MSISQEPPAPTTAPVVQGRLIGHFQDRPLNGHASGWSSLWGSNESGLWDRGRPSLALVDLIEEEENAIFQPTKSNGERKKALVPGCGRGYDVVMLALHGFDAYGLEISATGVAAARKYAATELRKPQKYNFGAGWTGPVEPGSVTFVEGDFFKNWERQVSTDGEVKFDLVYDYTFLCALHPQMRPQWVARMGQLVRPDGVLVCLEFPMYKDLTQPGPPWGLNGVHWDILARGGDGLKNIGKETEVDQVDELPGRFRRLLYRKPSRSYEAGRGQDMLSVYAPK